MIALLSLLVVALIVGMVYSTCKVHLANLRRKGFLLIRDEDSWTLQVCG